MTETTGLVKPFSKLDEFLLIYLKSYYKNHPEFPWSETDTKISISSPFSLISEDMTFLPKILVFNGVYSMTNYGFITNDQSNRPLAEYTQTRDQLYRIGTVYFLYVFAKTPKQAKSIAEELTVMFAMYTDRIKEKFGITIQKTFDLSPETPQVEGIDFKNSSERLTLICSYNYNLSTNVLPIYPKLADIDLIEDVDKEFKNVDNSKIKFVL
jgi:hypothetical protein